MNKLRNRSLFFGAFCIMAAYALAYTTGPCDSSYPSCDHSKEGISCGGGTSTITFGDPITLGLYYCGGNTSGRCGGLNPTGTCSELLFRSGTACDVKCGDTDLGYCYDSLSTTVVQTGYDCGDNPCPDVPADQRVTPNIIGTTAPCDAPHGTPCLPFPTAG